MVRLALQEEMAIVLWEFSRDVDTHRKYAATIESRHPLSKFSPFVAL